MSDSHLYLVIMNGVRKWVPIREAGAACDNGWCKVELGGFVREQGGNTERPITEHERRLIVQIADEHSASK